MPLMKASLTLFDQHLSIMLRVDIARFCLRHSGLRYSGLRCGYLRCGYLRHGS
jgi:hypothetical protein